MTDEQRADRPAELDLTTMERVIAVGDLSQLTPEERFSYYMNVCMSVGLNPYTQPFKYVVLKGALKLYATKDATDQLRRLHRISVSFDAPETKGDVMYVRARAKMPSGRYDEDIGAVVLANTRGEAAANAMMKCHTKAKRRVTLSICGLGDMPDETELETMGEVQQVDFVEAQGKAPVALEASQPASLPQPRASAPAEPAAPPPPISEERSGGLARQGPPVPEGPPVGFEDRPNPDIFHTDEEVQQLVDSGQIVVEQPRAELTLPQVMMKAMGEAKSLDELSDITRRVMDLKFEDHELVPIREAYKKAKGRLRS